MTIYTRLDLTNHMISDQQDGWIKSQISTDHFGNESEVVRELVRACQIREQETPAEIAALGAALSEGESSGMSERAPSPIINTVIERKRKNSGLSTDRSD